MVKVVKTKADGKHLYINILDFKDETEQDIIMRKVNEVIRDHNSRVLVY